jgi:hypothetical protein
LSIKALHGSVARIVPEPVDRHVDNVTHVEHSQAAKPEGGMHDVHIGHTGGYGLDGAAEAYAALDRGEIAGRAVVEVGQMT